MQLDLEPFRDPHKTRSMGSSFNKHQKSIYKTEAWRGRLSWMPKAAPLLKGCEDLLSSPSPPLLQPAQPSYLLPASSCVCRFLSVVYIRTMAAIWNGSHCTFGVSSSPESWDWTALSWSFAFLLLRVVEAVAWREWGKNRNRPASQPSIHIPIVSTSGHNSIRLHTDQSPFPLNAGVYKTVAWPTSSFTDSILYPTHKISP